MQIEGLHHVTLITSDSKRIYDFFTNILGLRLVKKTVNQDDYNTYHLYFADYSGTPGSIVTFFEFNDFDKKLNGTDELSSITFKVRDEESLIYFKERFEFYKVKHSRINSLFGYRMLSFSDFDDQEYALIVDDITNSKERLINHLSSVPDEYAITGLGPINFKISNIQSFEKMISTFLNFKLQSKVDNNYCYELTNDYTTIKFFVNNDKTSYKSIQGYGSIHHLAFKVKNEDELEEFLVFLRKSKIPSSMIIDRQYFKSIYFRVYPNILFEAATIAPGFITKEENIENLGSTLDIPKKFEDIAEDIRRSIKPFNTKRDKQTIRKEYFDKGVMHYGK